MRRGCKPQPLPPGEVASNRAGEGTRVATVVGESPSPLDSSLPLPKERRRTVVATRPNEEASMYRLPFCRSLVAFFACGTIQFAASALAEVPPAPPGYKTEEEVRSAFLLGKLTPVDVTIAVPD